MKASSCAAVPRGQQERWLVAEVSPPLVNDGGIVRGFDLTQAAFAEQLGISQSQLSKYERGLMLPTAEVLLRLKQKFNVSVELATDGYTVERCLHRRFVFELGGDDPITKDGQISASLPSCQQREWGCPDDTKDRSNFLCANEQYYLLRDNSPVCWPKANGAAFINAVIGLWNNWP